MLLVGIENIDYQNKQGKRIVGTKLHMTYPKDNCVGDCVFSEFVGNGVSADVEIGDEIQLLYNKFGKVIEVSKVSL